MANKPVIILTGCSGELGKTFIQRYAQDYEILGISRHNPPNTQQAYRFFQAHLPEDAGQVVSACIELHGRLDLIVNNAVIYDLKDITDTNMEDFSYQLAVNVAAPLALANEGLKQYWRQQPGEENLHKHRGVIHISSMSGVTAFLGHQQGAYASCKSALNMLTLHMADEYARYGVSVNAIAPGNFPHTISTESVCKKIIELWQSKMSGEILRYDANTCQYLKKNEQRA